MMRLPDPRQLTALHAAVERIYLEHVPDEDPGRPSWVEILPVDVADTRLVAVRFPGRIMRPADPDEGETQPAPAIGVYVGIIDNAGELVYASHSTAGTLPLR